MEIGAFGPWAVAGIGVAGAFRLAALWLTLHYARLERKDTCDDR